MKSVDLSFERDLSDGTLDEVMAKVHESQLSGVATLVVSHAAMARAAKVAARYNAHDPALRLIVRSETAVPASDWWIRTVCVEIRVRVVKSVCVRA